LTALKAGYRWLDVYCGDCGQVKPIDLASVDINPQACLTSLILMLRCRQCGGHGPLPKLIVLSTQHGTFLVACLTAPAARRIEGHL
jgi:hypothetical protein